MTSNLNLCTVSKSVLKPVHVREHSIAVRRDDAYQRCLTQELCSIDLKIAQLSLEKKKISIAKQKFKENLNVYSSTNNRWEKENRKNARENAGRGEMRIGERIISLPRLEKKNPRLRSSSMSDVSVMRNKDRFIRTSTRLLRVPEDDLCDEDTLPVITEKRRGTLNNMEIIQSMIQIRTCNPVQLDTNAVDLHDLSPLISRKIIAPEQESPTFKERWSNLFVRKDEKILTDRFNC